MILKKIVITVLSILFMGNVLVAQRTWSLEKCIKHVQQNNTTNMRSATFEVEKNKIIKKREEAQRKPSLGFGTNLGLNLGRNVDPSTNSFVNDFTLYNNFSVEGNYTLYDGNKTNKRVEQSELDIKVAQAKVDQLSKDLSLQVLQAYLRILMAEEQLANAQKNLQQTESWFRQTKNQVNAGKKSPSDLRNVEIQKARDEQKIIDRQNFLERSYVELKLILELDPSLALKIEKPKKIPAPDKKIQNLSFKKIYSKALNTQPGVRGGEFELKSLALDEKIALAEKSPSVSLFSGVYTNYSSGIVDNTKPDLSKVVDVEIDDIVLIPSVDSDPIAITYFGQEGIEFPSSPYLKQLGNNIGLGVGVNVYVPILDKNSAKLNSEIAKVNYLQKQEDNLYFKQQLRTNIQNAIDDVKWSVQKLEAAEKTLKLMETQILAIRNKLNLGSITAFELTTILNDRATAEFELVIAKYEFLLKKMIVEFYEGKKLKIEK